MSICLKRRVETARRIASASKRSFAVAAAAGLLGMLLVGCASPGLPLAPSLKLPEAVSASGLEAVRTGNQVTLHWTTTTRTTDKQTIAGPITAEICRETRGQPVAAKSAAADPCALVVQRLQVAPGASNEAADPLPAELLSEPARLLAYRVQLRNAAGRTAGPSPAVYAASGPSPAPLAEFSGHASKTGAVLEWKPLAVSARSGALSIVLERTTVEQPKPVVAKPAAGASAGQSQLSNLLGAPKEPTVESLRAAGTSAGMGGGGTADPGGTIDRTAELGQTYRYTAQRVLTVVVGGQTLEVRSAPSSPVTVAMTDVFPPEAPTGLLAVPSFAGEAGGEAAAIDLSWQPNMEPRIAGYRVYRRDLAGEGAWILLTAKAEPEAAYRDRSVAEGARYAYRVTAVSGAGVESVPSAEVVVTGPAR